MELEILTLQQKVPFIFFFFIIITVVFECRLQGLVELSAPVIFYRGSKVDDNELRARCSVIWTT